MLRMAKLCLFAAILVLVGCDEASTPAGTASEVAFEKSGTNLDVDTTQEAIVALLTRIELLEADLNNSKIAIASQAATITSLQDTVSGQAAAITGVEIDLGDLDSSVTSQLSELATKTAAMSVDTVDGYDAVIFTGVNVFVQNGEGDTETTNGVGNLVVGYNELLGMDADIRTGSHNLVTGQENNYSSYGGIVAGWGNSITGPWATVTGGHRNTASGLVSSVSGGSDNTASGDASSVSGGADNTASGMWSSVSGGRLREADGSDDWAAGNLFEDY